MLMKEKKSDLVSFWKCFLIIINFYLLAKFHKEKNKKKGNVSLNGHFVVYNYFGKFMILSEKQNWLPFP